VAGRPDNAGARFGGADGQRPAQVASPGGIWSCHKRNTEVVNSAAHRLACRAFSGAGVVADSNGDGFTDLAIGAPGARSGHGEVNVIFGSAAGLTSTGNRLLVNPSISPLRGDEEQFGRAVAAGDFNDDGFGDLVIGDLGADSVAADGRVQPDTGAIHVYRGPDFILRETFRNLGGVPKISQAGDRFGDVLAVGNFNGYAFPDLAIGLPRADLSGTDAGAAVVVYGSSLGLFPAGIIVPASQLWSQSSPGVQGVAEGFNEFGAALTIGDFNGAGRSDLAVGVPGEATVFASQDNGGVNILYGSDDGLNATGNQFWSQGSTGILGAPEAFNRFGAALAAGDFDKDGRADWQPAFRVTTSNHSTSCARSTSAVATRRVNWAAAC
jgi:FG-GAP repeat